MESKDDECCRHCGGFVTTDLEILALHEADCRKRKNLDEFGRPLTVCKKTSDSKLAGDDPDNIGGFSDAGVLAKYVDGVGKKPVLGKSDDELQKDAEKKKAKKERQRERKEAEAEAEAKKKAAEQEAKKKAAEEDEAKKAAAAEEEEAKKIQKPPVSAVDTPASDGFNVEDEDEKMKKENKLDEVPSTSTSTVSKELAFASEKSMYTVSEEDEKKEEEEEDEDEEMKKKMEEEEKRRKKMEEEEETLVTEPTSYEIKICESEASDADKNSYDDSMDDEEVGEKRVDERGTVGMGGRELEELHMELAYAASIHEANVAAYKKRVVDLEERERAVRALVVHLVGDSDVPILTHMTELRKREQEIEDMLANRKKEMEDVFARREKELQDMSTHLTDGGQQWLKDREHDLMASVRQREIELEDSYYRKVEDLKKKHEVKKVVKLDELPAMSDDVADVLDLDSYFKDREKALMDQKAVLVEAQHWTRGKQGRITKAWVTVQQMLLSRSEENKAKDKMLSAREEHVVAREAALCEKNRELID